MSHRDSVNLGSAGGDDYYNAMEISSGKLRIGTKDLDASS